MIPKIIHYCWFGKQEKPEKIQKCLATWQKNCPDYQIIEWNEENFDIELNMYVKQAYAAKKYAFVSDVARVQALYEHGGIYLDTDVEVFQNFDQILDNQCVLGYEEANWIATSFMAVKPKYWLMKQFLDEYSNIDFIDQQQKQDTTTNVQKLTEMLDSYGLQRDGKFTILNEEIIIYPQVYFSPYDYINCISKKTAESICEHKFYVSWLPAKVRVKKKVKFVISHTLGPNVLNKMRAMLKG